MIRRALLALLAGLLTWWLTKPPSSTRDGLPDVANLPTATFDGSRVTIHDVRNFVYRTETARLGTPGSAPSLRQ